MIVFKFNRFGQNLGTRQLGEQVRQELLAIINANDMTVLDFEGVNVVANSFADECIGKLLLEIPLNELKSKTTFRSVNDMARTCIATAIKRRSSAIA